MPDPNPNPNPNPNPAPTVPEWHTHLTDELKADPVVAAWAEKASEKDVPSIIKGLAHSTKRLGSAINLPGKDAKPEEIQALRTKLYEAGVFTAPPGKPEDYGIVKPEKLPEGIGWNEDLGKKVAAAFHKHGIPKAAVPDLMALYEEALMGVQKTLQTNADTGFAALKKEFGDRYDELKDAVGRMMPAIFKTPEELAFWEEIGAADDPRFLGPMMRFAPLAMQDSSFMANAAREGGQLTPEQVTAEVADIMQNPKNPRYEGYHRGDKAVSDYIDELYRKAHGTKPVEIGGGISVTIGG